MKKQARKIVFILVVTSIESSNPAVHTFDSEKACTPYMATRLPIANVCTLKYVMYFLIKFR